MQQTNSNISGNNLQQGAGGLQNGQGGLQQQSDQAGTTQSQTTNQPQQDVLGLDAYRNVEGLSVQGQPTSQSQSTPAAKGYGQVLFLLFFALVIIAVLIGVKFSKSIKKTPKDTPLEEQVSVPVPAIVATDASKKPELKKSTSKKNKSPKKVTKKKKASAKKKK